MSLAVVVADDEHRRCSLPVGLPLPLRAGFCVGRGADCDVVIDGYQVARRDVEFVDDGGGWAVRPLWASQRTPRDGAVRAGPVRAGDVLDFPWIELRVVDLDDHGLVARGDWFIPRAHAGFASSVAWRWTGGALREGYLVGGVAGVAGVADVADVVEGVGVGVALDRVVRAAVGDAEVRDAGGVGASLLRTAIVAVAHVDRAWLGVDFDGRVVVVPGGARAVDRLRVLVSAFDAPTQFELRGLLGRAYDEAPAAEDVAVVAERAVVVRGLFADEHRAARDRREQRELLDPAQRPGPSGPAAHDPGAAR